MTKQAAWKLLEDSIHPLDAHLKEKRFRSRLMLSIRSDDERLNRAFYAAVALCTQLGIDCSASLQAGTHLTSSSPSSETPLIFDTGCGRSISPCIDNFVTELEPVPDHIGVTNFENGVTKPEGQGWVEWNTRDPFGCTSTVCTFAHYIPNAQVQLFFPWQN